MKSITPNFSTDNQTKEKFLIAIGKALNAKSLILKGHEMALAINASWIVVHVMNDDDTSPEEQAVLKKNINFARELGAETIVVHDFDITDAISKIVIEKKITQVVIGQCKRKKSRIQMNKVASQTKYLSVHILASDGTSKKKYNQIIAGYISPSFEILNSRPIDYFYTLLFLIFVTCISVLVNPYLGYRAVGYLYLMAVIVVGFRSTMGPILLSAISGAFFWNFIFIPPQFTFHISDPEDRMMCLTFIFAGILSGFLARKTKKREKLLILRENNTRNIYNLLSDFSKAMSVSEICDLAKKSVLNLLNSNIEIILSHEENHLPRKILRKDSISSQDFALAELSLKHQKEAGWSTNIFSDSKCLSIPLIATQKTIGVILFYPPNLKKQLSLDEESLLNNICIQLAIALEHFILQLQNQEIQLFKESEKLHQTLLNSVSHEMRIPLTSIQGNVSALQNEKVQSDSKKVQLIHLDLIQSCQRLNQVIENLLDMNRINSDFLTLKKEWIEAYDLVTSVTALIKNNDHIFSVNEKTKNIIIQCDVKLMEHALLNLLLNAKKYSAPASEIKIEIDISELYIIFRVQDQGIGIPEDKLELVFNKFYRLPGSATGGLGLGLSIVKGIAEAHNGYVIAKISPDNCGAIFEMHIPWHKNEIDFNEDFS